MNLLSKAAASCHCLTVPLASANGMQYIHCRASNSNAGFLHNAKVQGNSKENLQRLPPLTPKRLSTASSTRNMTASAANAEHSESMAASAGKGAHINNSSFFSFLLSERAKVIALLAVAMALCNADRVVMSVAVVPLAAAHNWSSGFAGVLQSSFLWGYLMSPIAGGALADHWGGKTVLAGGVALWSLATLLTPWAATCSFGRLLGIRVLMGIGEGVALPCMNNIISMWFPRSERARAVGFSMAGFHLGSVIGLLATPLILTCYGIPGPFNAFGLLGLCWLILWVLLIPKNPESCHHISKRELAFIRDENGGTERFQIGIPAAKSSTNLPKLPPFSMLLSKSPAWAVIVANSMHCWGYFVLLSWMPIYFNTVFGINLQGASWFSALPWAMMGAVGFGAGMLSDRLISSGMTVTFVRKLMQTIGFLGPAIALLGLNAAENVRVGACWLTIAVGLSSFSHAGFLVNFQEIGPRYAGVLHGIANTAGTIAGIIGTIATGYCVQWLGSFRAFLSITAIMYIASAIFWNIFATGERIFD